MQKEPQNIDWDKLIDLLEKPVDEQQALASALSTEEQAFFARLQQVKDDQLLTGALQLDAAKAWVHIMEKEERAAPVRRIAINWKKWVAAASLLFIAGTAWWLYTKFGINRTTHELQTVEQGMANHEPASKVQLVTANGQIVVIDTTTQLREKDGTLIQLQQGIVAYENSEHSKGDASLMNTLIVPRGYLYSLVLSDGSKVWLNADSKISYPVRFDKTERKVTIEGEAFFEVVHNDKWPFVVYAANTATKVLGTSFDIKAYGNKIYATLVTGSVLFTPPGNAKAVKLTPDHQTVFNTVNSINETRKVFAGDFIAWKDDDLVMTKMTLAELVEILERRYDVQISFAEEKLKNIEYNGALHLTNNIAEMLTNFEQTSNIRFAVKDKKIVILPANGK
jgi:transmembrane sensor